MNLRDITRQLNPVVHSNGSGSDSPAGNMEMMLEDPKMEFFDIERKFRLKNKIRRARRIRKVVLENVAV